jgi:hypothetical protein
MLLLIYGACWSPYLWLQFLYLMFPYLQVHVILCEFSVDPYNVGGSLGLVGMCKPIGNIDINVICTKYFFP